MATCHRLRLRRGLLAGRVNHPVEVVAPLDQGFQSVLSVGRIYSAGQRGRHRIGVGAELFEDACECVHRILVSYRLFLHLAGSPELQFGVGATLREGDNDLSPPARRVILAGGSLRFSSWLSLEQTRACCLFIPYRRTGVLDTERRFELAECRLLPRAHAHSVFKSGINVADELEASDQSLKGST